MTEKIRHDEAATGKRDEVIDLIRKKMRKITNGDLHEPIYLSNVSILDSACTAGNGTACLQVNSIFCDDSGTLCGDLVGEINVLSNGLMFGQSIENIQLEDLENLLNHLNDESYSVIINDNSMKMQKVFPFNSIKKKSSRFARGA